MPPQIPSASGEVVDSTYAVGIVDYAFRPLHLNITTGTIVIWTYAINGTTIHTVTSNPGTNQTQGHTPLLDSGSLNPGQSYNHTFNQPGFFPFQCAFHPTIPEMNGWAKVTGDPVTAPPTPQDSSNLLLLVTVGIATAVVASSLLVWALKRRRKTSISPGPNSG